MAVIHSALLWASFNKIMTIKQVVKRLFRILEVIAPIFVGVVSLLFCLVVVGFYFWTAYEWWVGNPHAEPVFFSMSLYFGAILGAIVIAIVLLRIEDWANGEDE